MTEQHEKLSNIVRECDVDAKCGLKRTQRKELIRQGRFPRPIKLSDRARGYLESELLAWQRERLAERDQNGGN
jgi:prophage regulatory protein